MVKYHDNFDCYVARLVPQSFSCLSVYRGYLIVYLEQAVYTNQCFIAY